jgi:hypothetical protein
VRLEAERRAAEEAALAEEAAQARRVAEDQARVDLQQRVADEHTRAAAIADLEAKEEARRVAAEQARIEAERRAAEDAERLAAEQAVRDEAEQLAARRAAQAEADRLAAAQAEAESLAAAQAEAERLAAEGGSLAPFTGARHRGDLPVEETHSTDATPATPPAPVAPAAFAPPMAAPTAPETPAVESTSSLPAVPAQAEAEVLAPGGAVDFGRRGPSPVVNGMLQVVLFALALAGCYFAYLDPTRVTIGVAGILCGALLFVAFRSGASQSHVRIDDGILEVLQGESRYKFDLANPRVVLEMPQPPSSRKWKVLIHRTGLPPFEVDSSLVDPQQFTDVIRQFRPNL